MSAAGSPDPDGVDYRWVMQTTFVLSIVVGAPVVALLSVWAPLETLPEMADFAVRTAAPVYLVLAAGVFLYARFRR